MMNIAICGLGLIGGSLAKAIKKKTDYRLIGLDNNEKVCSDAKFLGVIDEKGNYKNISQADIIIVALHPKATVQFILEYMPYFKKGSIIFDTCGVKTYILDNIDAIAKNHGVIYVGAHPMAGREFSGFEYSTDTLYEGASMILTPTQTATTEALQAVEDLCYKLGFGKVVVTEAENHDRMIAFTSQLAHIVSSAYIKSPEATQHSGYSAGSYKDLTRVARLNENMWTELFLMNKEPLVKEIDEIIKHLKEYRDTIQNGDEEHLRVLLKQGRDIKESIG